MNRLEFLRTLAWIAAASRLGGTGTPFGQAGARGDRKNWAWVRGDLSSAEPWKPRFAAWRRAGIDAVLPNSGDPETLERIAAAADDEGLETHAWIFTLMRGGMESAHPEWYAVNRLGESTATSPPYVDYYKFLCPTREPVQEHVLDHVRTLTGVGGIAGIHLDYVRYPDVILPRALWDTYDLVQDREYPPFDYCYCDVCRGAFREQSGRDPLRLPDPPSDERWLQFRYDSVTRLVGRLAAAARAGGKSISAAVFPTPTIARELVRQDWTRWDLDAVLPMIYQSFYEEPVSWIEAATREGVDALDGRIPLYAGLYVPELNPEELAEATRRALAGGAEGIALFESQVPTAEHWQRLTPLLTETR